MSEQSPEPEKQPRPIGLSCESCCQDFVARADNTVNYLFLDEPEFSVICIQHLTDECSYWNAVFHDQHPPLLAEIATEYPTSIYRKLEDLVADEPATVKWIKEQRSEVEYEPQEEAPAPLEAPKPIEPRILTPRQENYIQHWGEFLQSIIIDETDFGAGDES